jgi:AcrR family transcriptional regulator
MDRHGTSALKTRRAAALPPEARRQAIVEATLPLLMDQGLAVTTRQIAEAAGIAEGTIFRVFPDKEALIAAAVEKALDPAPLEARLAEIDATRPLEGRLLEAVAVMQERAERLWQLMSNVGFTRPAGDDESRSRRSYLDIQSLAALFQPDADALRFDAAGSARRLRALAIAGTHPALVGEQPLTPEEIVSQFLDGARVR